MKEDASKEARRPNTRPFGQGRVEEAAPPAKHITCADIQRRLRQLLGPLLEARGGLVATLDESGLYGLAITFENGQTFDVLLREVTP